jgi:hypothetical protein
MDDDERVVMMDGWDEAAIGCAYVWSTDGTRPLRAVYSGEKIVELLMSRDGLTEEEALEHIDFNMEGAYVGPQTPIIVWHSMFLDAMEASQ